MYWGGSRGQNLELLYFSLQPCLEIIHSWTIGTLAISCVMFLMALNSRVHAQAVARGQDLGHFLFINLSLLLLKNDLLFSI